MKVLNPTIPAERRTSLEFSDQEILLIEYALHDLVNKSTAPTGTYAIWDEVDDVRIELSLDSIRA